MYDTFESIYIPKFHPILFYHPKKLLYQLYNTILQYTSIPKLYFFPFYLNILFYSFSFFYYFSFSLPFPLFLSQPLAPMMIKATIKPNHQSISPNPRRSHHRSHHQTKPKIDVNQSHHWSHHQIKPPSNQTIKASV